MSENLPRIKLLAVWVIFLVFCIPNSVSAQKKKGQARIDSLIAELPLTAADTNRVNLLTAISSAFRNIKPIDGIKFGEQGLELAKLLNYRKGMAILNNVLGLNYHSQKEFSKAISCFKAALKINESLKSKSRMVFNLGNMANVYNDIPDFKHAEEYYLKAIELCVETGEKAMEARYCSNLGTVYDEQGILPRALEYNLRAIKISEKEGTEKDMADYKMRLGMVYVSKGRFAEGIAYIEQSLTIYESIGNKKGVTNALSNIGRGYLSQNNYPKAMEYYWKALKQSEEQGDTYSIALILGNLGYCFREQGNYEEGLKYFNKALKLDIELEDKILIAFNTGHVGITYYYMAKDSGKIYLGDSTFNLTKKYLIAKSTEHILQAIESFKILGKLNQVQYYSRHLSLVYMLSNEYDKALEAYKQHVVFKDSVYNLEKNRLFASKELDFVYAKRQDSLELVAEKERLLFEKEIQLNALKYEYEKKQTLAKTEEERQLLKYEENLKRQQIETDFARKQMKIKTDQDKKDALSIQEIRRQKNIRNASVMGAGLLLLLLIISIVAYRQRQKSTKIIIAEKQRSEELLLNILPAEVAEELKINGKARAKDHDEVSILFSDFKGFTQASENMSAQELVNELNTCFENFDRIIGKYNIEKIKTIGDSYMAASGVPLPVENSAKNTILAALEMQDFIETRKNKKEAAGGLGFEMRVGIHTGAVVAGIVGVKKFAYDIWGDTVNIASRMESAGEPSRVNISETTYNQVRDDPNFVFVSRGMVAAKHKGDMEMYFVNLAV